MSAAIARHVCDIFCINLMIAIVAGGLSIRWLSLRRLKSYLPHQPPTDFIEVSTVDGCGPGNESLWSEPANPVSRRVENGCQGRNTRPVSRDSFCVSQSRLSTLRQRLWFERVRAVRSNASGDFCGESPPSRPPVRRGLCSSHRHSLCQGYAARRIYGRERVRRSGKRSFRRAAAD